MTADPEALRLGERFRRMQIPPERPTYEFGTLQDYRDAIEAQSRRALEMTRKAGLEVPHAND